MTYGARLFEHGDLTADRILRAIDPRIVVVAADDPLVGTLIPRQARDHVVSGHDLEVEFRFQMNRGRTRPDVIGDWKRAAPRVGRDRACHRPEQRKRVGIRNRQNRNFRQGGRLTDLQALCVWGRAYAGRQRVAWVERHVGHRAALGAIFVAPRALRINVALVITVVAWVRIDEASDGSVFCRHLWLDATPRAAIARDHDPAFDIDPAALQFLVVLRNAVVHVHKLCRHVTVD